MRLPRDLTGAGLIRHLYVTREDIQAALAFAAEHLHEKDSSTPQTPAEIDAFFRNHNVEMSNYKFDREEANAI